jgi:RimJ/RimL family protein N-acetyltransferase
MELVRCMNLKIVTQKDRSHLLPECARLASKDSQKNLLLLADLYPPHLSLSEIYMGLRNGKLDDFSNVYRGFSQPSIVLGIAPPFKERLLNHILTKINGDFTCICEPEELNLFRGRAEIVKSHKEYQMVLKEPILPEGPQKNVEVELVQQSELWKLDHFLKGNGALAWLPVQFESGPYYCVKLDGEIVSVAGVHFVTPQVAQLGNIVTAWSYRGRGYATNNTYALASALHSLGVMVSLFVMEDNSQAVRIYEKIGFQKRRKLVYALLRT